MYTPDIEKKPFAYKKLQRVYPSGAYTRRSSSVAVKRAIPMVLSLLIIIILFYQWDATRTGSITPVADTSSGKGPLLPKATISSITPALQGAVVQHQQHNRDAVGWLIVPDTEIDQVVLQNPYELGNSYYLTHNYFGEEDTDGMFCADRRIEFGTGTRAELPMITTIYGHSWDDDPESTLFSQLKHYRDADFARAHPYIFFSTDAEDMVWEVFAVFDTTIHLPYVWPELPSDVYSQVMSAVKKLSIYDYGIQATTSDKILVLSTCTYYVNGRSLPLDQENDYRFVIMARLLEPEAPIKESAVLTVNSNPMSPDAIPEILLPWQDSRF